MNISMFTSWQVRCGIADYTKMLVNALQQLDNMQVAVVPFDRQPHPRSDFRAWGRQMNTGDVAHVQHEYAFFGYLLPWKNHFSTFVSEIQKPLVITRHVSLDGRLMVQGSGLRHTIWQAKWAFYSTRLNPYATVLNKKTFDVAQQIIVLTGRLKEQLLARGIDESKVHVIPPGVPDVPHATRDEALRASWGWQDKRIICHFGFVAPAKGHLIALDALAQLPDDYVYLIAGGSRIGAHDAYVEQIHQRVHMLGLSQRVRMTGYLLTEEIAPMLAASDVLIFPNTHADFSYSLVTAIACGSAPIVAADVYSHREVAGECAGVALFNAGDATHLAREIQRVCNDDDMRARMLEGMRNYTQHHTWARVAEHTRAVYELALRR